MKREKKEGKHAHKKNQKLRMVFRFNQGGDGNIRGERLPMKRGATAIRWGEDVSEEIRNPMRKQATPNEQRGYRGAMTSQKSPSEITHREKTGRTKFRRTGGREEGRKRGGECPLKKRMVKWPEW